MWRVLVKISKKKQRRKKKKEKKIVVNIDPDEEYYTSESNDDDNYKPCLDPESKATLYPLDNFDWNGSDLTQRPLNLRTEARRLSSGRFTRNSVSYQSIEIKGRCCWEAFSRPGFRGRKLRLCRGKFNSNILGSLSNNILSIRPVEHFT